MGEAVGHRIPAAAAAADRPRWPGRADRLFERRLSSIWRPLVILVGPHAGEAIRLSSIRPTSRWPASRLTRCFCLSPWEDAQQVLHVMADLVRDHIGIGEVAAAAHAGLHVLKEQRVEVHLLSIGQ